MFASDAGQELYARICELGTATVHEAASGAGLLDLPLQQLIAGSRAAGPARIAACGQGDNRAVHEVMAHATAGDVLVVTMPTPAPHGMIGELLARQAARCGVAAIIVDGGVRDTDELRELGLPIWARHVRVRGTTKTVRGAIDVPVRVGGSLIEPGDVVVLDADGAVVIPRARAQEVLEAGERRLASEAELRARLDAGERTYEIFGYAQADRERQS